MSKGKQKENLLCPNNNDSFGFLFDDEELWIDGGKQEQDCFFSLNTEECAHIRTRLIELKKNISSFWYKSGEMEGFYKKYNISNEEAMEYIGHFLGEKILGCIINKLEKGEKENEKHIFISTKFLSFIREKKIGIEGLLKLIIALKNKVIEGFFDENLKIIKQLSYVFDRISTDVSKNYNDIVIKLLNEYIHAIDASDIITKTDIHGNITSANDEFCRLSGYTQMELIGKPHNIVRHPDMPKTVFKEIWETIQSKKIWKGNVQNRTKDGGSYWVKATIIPILDANDQIIEYISIRTDITELQEAYKNLEELDIKKDEFLNIASHELRTPMTSIKGYISMILDGDAGEINDEVREYLNQVYKGSERLLNLINDMLDVSKIESGRVKLHIKPINLSEIIKEIDSEVKGLFLEKEQDFSVSIDLKESTYLLDRDKIKQILLNLLGNANKFTPRGGSISLSCMSTNQEIILRVKDAGIGIKKSDFGKIFEKFGQVKNSLTRDIDGTGLGLPIVKAIVEQMHGYVEVESSLGEGSTFSVHIPMFEKI